MLVFAAITPHPPIIIPGIGQKADLERVEKTITAMEKLRARLESAKVDALILISPHAPIEEVDAFGINSDNPLAGDLRMFGLASDFKYKNAQTLLQEIVKSCSKVKIDTYFHNNPLDHGTLVPLFYLTKNIKPDLVSLSFSFLDYPIHFKYGQAIGKACQHYGKRVAVVASGDLSHRLFPGAPAGYSPKGKEFDEQLLGLFARREVKKILALEDGLVEEAGECGLRSFIILLGVLEGKDYHFEILSYEGPFGVGYLAAELTLKNF